MKESVSVIKILFVLRKSVHWAQSFSCIDNYFIDLTKIFSLILLNTQDLLNLTKIFGWTNENFSLINKILLAKEVC